MKRYKTIKLVLVRRSGDGHYFRKNRSQIDGGLILLWLFFTGCVGYDSKDLSFIREEISKGTVGCNDIGATIIDAKLQFSHDVIEGLEEPRLTKEELLALVDKWFELVAAKAGQIVITNDNGKFSIEVE